MQDLVGLVPSRDLINFYRNGVISEHMCMASTITKEKLVEVISGSFNQIHYERRKAPIMINSKTTNQEATKLGVKVERFAVVFGEADYIIP